MLAARVEELSPDPLPVAQAAGADVSSLSLVAAPSSRTFERWNGTLEHLFVIGWIVIDDHDHWLWNHTRDLVNDRPTLTWNNRRQSPAAVIWELVNGAPLPEGFTPRRRRSLCTHRRCVDLRHYGLSKSSPGKPPSSDTPWNGTLAHLFEIGWIKIVGDHWIWTLRFKPSGRPMLSWHSRILNPALVVWEQSGQEPLQPGYTIKHNTAVCTIQECVHFQHHFPFKKATGRPHTKSAARLSTNQLLNFALGLQSGTAVTGPAASQTRHQTAKGRTANVKGTSSSSQAESVASPVLKSVQQFPTLPEIAPVALSSALLAHASLGTAAAGSELRPRPAANSQPQPPWNGRLEQLFALQWIRIEGGHWVWHYTVWGSRQLPVIRRIQGQPRSNRSAALLIFAAAGNPSITKGFVLTRNPERCSHLFCVHPAHHHVTRLNQVRDPEWNGRLEHLFELKWIRREGNHWIWCHIVRKSDGRPIIRRIQGRRRSSRSAVLLVYNASGESPVPRGFELTRNREVCNHPLCVHPAHHHVTRRGASPETLAKGYRAYLARLEAEPVETALARRIRQLIVTDVSGCWRWTGSFLDTPGRLKYARLRFRRGKHREYLNINIRRFLWKRIQGAIPEHQVLWHVFGGCSYPEECVNPIHMRLLKSGILAADSATASHLARQNALGGKRRSLAGLDWPGTLWVPDIDAGVCMRCRRNFDQHGVDELVGRKLSVPLNKHPYVCWPATSASAPMRQVTRA